MILTKEWAESQLVIRRLFLVSFPRVTVDAEIVIWVVWLLEFYDLETSKVPDLPECLARKQHVSIL